MPGSSRPPDDAPTAPVSPGPSPESDDELEDDFYQAVSLDDLLAGAWPEEEDEEEQPEEPAPLASSSAPRLVPATSPSLAAWVAVYYRDVVADAPRKTEAAKRTDLERFLNFVVDTLGHDHVDAWVPELTARFQEHLSRTRSPATGRRLSPATVNRVLSTVRRFAVWLGECRGGAGVALLAGVRRLPPTRGRRRVPTRPELTRLWRVCQDRVAAGSRRDQSPLLEAALLQVLVGTALRPGEVSALDLEQYHSKAFHGAFRRGGEVLARVKVPAEVRRWLDRYLAEARGSRPGALFLGRGGQRLQPAGIARLVTRLAVAAFPGELWSRGLTPAALRAAGPQRLR